MTHVSRLSTSPGELYKYILLAGSHPVSDIKTALAGRVSAVVVVVVASVVVVAVGPGVVVPDVWNRTAVAPLLVLRFSHDVKK